MKRKQGEDDEMFRKFRQKVEQKCVEKNAKKKRKLYLGPDSVDSIPRRTKNRFSDVSLVDYITYPQALWQWCINFPSSQNRLCTQSTASEANNVVPFPDCGSESARLQNQVLMPLLLIIYRSFDQVAKVPMGHYHNVPLEAAASVEH